MYISRVNNYRNRAILDAKIITSLANFAYCIGLSGLLELYNIAIMCLFRYEMHCSFAKLLRQACSYIFMNTDLSIASQD